MRSGWELRLGTEEWERSADTAVKAMEWDRAPGGSSGEHLHLGNRHPEKWRGDRKSGPQGPRKAREQRISGWEWPEAAVLPQKMTTKRVHRFSVNVSQGPRQVY